MSSDSFTNSQRRRGKGELVRHGFTLLEVLLTLGILALMSGVLIAGAIRLTESKVVTPEDLFWKAVAESRKHALLTGHEVRLRFVTKDKSSALVGSSVEGEKKYPYNGGELIIDFLSTQKGGSAILIHSQLVETQTIPYVTFYGDGTCSPFRVQFRTGGPARSLSIDPWTCAPILDTKAAAAAARRT